ncbi:gamma subclass chorismate mutase AroQ [Kribbella capetownensis]|uniref:gamma subclass chorismate mutase AroQ n=1 Tax=Kribbella capetownensis TaxID=1572659 RepID=UPI0013F3B997|nr:gamma subclass chorismate mutase AroQ [Kribbella capetownensis]
MLRRVISGVIVAGVVGVTQAGTSAFAAPAATVPAQGSTQTAELHEAPVRLDGLTELVIRRILVGDEVAASKYFSGKPVEDPVREQQIIDSVRASAVQLGIDPDSTADFVRAQIEASKVVQRGLLAKWAADPSSAPTSGPDLDAVRQELDELTTGLLTELVRVDHVRHTGLACDISLLVATTTGSIEHHFDRLHRQALAVGTAAVCG